MSDIIQITKPFVISFLPLVTRKVGMRPSQCNSICGTSNCAKKNLNGKCLTKCLETAKCGGWAKDISNPITYASFEDRVRKVGQR